ncbi:MAG TPA: hypothetical protein VHN36_02655 [Ilumatobacteraceae bacterium]|nr:hypothetical protein [Ilumatobacteraceae bacterium]
MFQRSRWSAVGAAVAVILGAGVVMPSASAAVTTGNRSVFVPIVPCRLFDTRSGSDVNVGPRATPIGPGEAYTQPVTGTNGHCVIPTDATAISMNVTAVGGTASSFLTVYPADAAPPQASNLNWTAGAAPTPNKVDVKLSGSGAINLFNLAGTVDVLADAVGYYADHNHDDRYYTKAEIDANVNDTLRTEVYGPYEMAWEQYTGLTTTTMNSCITNTTGSGIYGEVPIHMPIGSRLISVDTVVLDTAGPGIYSVDLIRTTITGSGSTISHLGTVANLGATTGIVHTLITPPTPEIAETGESYTVRVGAFDLSFNAFCQVSVVYDTKP